MGTGVTQFKKKGKKIVEDILNGIKDTELKNSFLKNRKIKNLIYGVILSQLLEREPFLPLFE